MKNWLLEFLKSGAAGPASLSGAPPAGPGNITPGLNPVQQIQQQRLAAAAQPSTPAGNPEVMKAEQAAAAAAQQAEQAQAQVQQEAEAKMQQMQAQLAQQQQKMQQESAQQQQQAHAELQAAKAEIAKSKAEADLAKIEAAKHTALSEIQAADEKHKANVSTSEAARQAEVAKSEVDSVKNEAAKAQQVSATGVDGQMAVLSHRLNTLGGPAPTKKKANTIQNMQYGIPKAESGKPGGILQTATYRPSFGGIGNKIADMAMPMVMGQPDWHKFFQRMQPTPVQGFDPATMAQNYGVDIARNLAPQIF